MFRVFFQLGQCPSYVREWEILKHSIPTFVEAKSMDEADLIIIYLCSLFGEEIKRANVRLEALRRIKAERPDVKICVGGCITGLEGYEKILEPFPFIDCIFNK